MSPAHQKSPTYIHRHRHGNHAQVEAKQPSILGKAIRNKPRPHQVNKVQVKTSVDEQENDLFDAVPDVINVPPRLIDPQASWDPDAKHADVDNEDDEECAKLELSRVLSDDHEDGDSVDDDLDEGL
jgi:hypothetical protein